MSRTEEDREFDAISEKDIFEEARDRLQICASAESNNRKRAKEAMLFREGKQWDDTPDSSVSQDEPELTINLTDAMVKRVENNIKQQRPRGKCHPVGDGADVEIAEIINGIGRHIETRSEASVAYDTAASCALDGGFGYFRLVAEYVDPRSFQKDLRIVPIRNCFTVYMDPSSVMPHGGDAWWDLVSVKMKRAEYKRRYPRAENAGWSDVGRDESSLDWEDAEDIRLAEYFRIREVEDKLYGIRGLDGSEFTLFQTELLRDGATGQFMTLDEAKKMLHEQGLFIEGKRDSARRQVEWFRLNGRKVVERQQIPGSYIPIFRVEGNTKDVDGNIIRRGMVESMMDPARMVNYGEVAKIKRLGLAPKAPWVVAEGQLEGHEEWTDANIKNFPVLTYKPIVLETSAGPVMVPPPQRQPPAQIEQGFAEFVQGMRSNLMGVAGMPNEPGQDEQGQVVSGRAIKRRQWLSDQSHFQYYDNLTLAIAQLWRVMLEWIPVYYSEQRMQRIIGEDSTPQMVELNTPEDDDENPGTQRIKNDLSVGKYDVVMDTGPGYETKREEGAENLIDLLKVQALAEIIAKTGPDLVFRSIDHPYMQELADRLMAQNPEGLKKIMEGLSSRAKSIVQAQANQIQAMEQQMKAMEADLKAGITKAHLAAAVKAHDTELKARTDMHDTDSRDATKLQTTEILVGGKLLDSRVVADHEATQAENQLIHNATQASLDRDHASTEAEADRIIQKSNQDETAGAPQ